MVDVRVQEPVLSEPRMRIVLRDEFGKGLVPVLFTINEVSVPCKAIELNLEAGKAGEIVLHIALPRCGVALDVSERKEE